MRELVVGMGEVGQALATYLDIPGRDIEPTDHIVDTLHIAFPWSKDFDAEVKDAADHHRATLVVVHSTVPAGTCDPHGWVHSPVRGRHPRLVESLGTFTKIFGGPRASEARWPGPRVDVSTAIETELGKLFELAQFGLQVRVNQAIYDYCAEAGVDPGTVYDLFGFSYNIGYTRLGESHFVRPVLEHMPGDIGGHCLAPGLAMLDHPIAELAAEGF